MIVPMGDLAGLGNDDAKSPTINSSIPLAPTGTSNRAVRTDVGGDDAAIIDRPLHPGIHVVEQPGSKPGLMRKHVGIQGQGGGTQVLWMIAKDICVVLEVF